MASKSADQAANAAALARVGAAGLIAAARASVAADRDGLQDPLSFVRDALARYGGLPPDNKKPHELIADATAADAIAAKVVNQ